MPSEKYTKINIDIELYKLLQNVADIKGLSATKLNEQAILYYLEHNK